jgi:hypothetical protein
MVALSSTKEKYVEATFASCESIWICKLIVEVIDKMLEATNMHYDDWSFIKLFETLVFHNHPKHIDIQ